MRADPLLAADAVSLREKEGEALTLAGRALHVRTAERAANEAREALLREGQAVEVAEATEAEAERADLAAREALSRAREEAEVLPALDESLRSLAAAEAALSDLAGTEKARVLAGKKFEDAVADAEDAASFYTALEARYFLAQAGILAQGLAEGKPCPVCGATAHPKPAALAEDTPDEGALRAARAHADATALYRGEMLAALRTAEGRVEAARGRLADLGVLPEVTSEQIATERAEKTALRARLATTLSGAEAGAEQAARTLAAARATTKARHEALALAEKRATAADEDFAARIKAAGFSGADAYRAALLDEHTLEVRTRALDKMRSDAARARGAIAELDSTVGGRTPVDVTVFATVGEALAAALAEIKGKEATLREVYSLNEHALLTLDEVISERRALDADWGVLETVYATVSGKGRSGKGKLSLESYVQRYYFKAVILAANRRLAVMTDGNFSLRLRDGARDMRSQGGLDLEVLDRSTGAWRDVSTLSGGESFLASLALAVGLSDVVQASSGSIRLDMLMIDEGFGSLDEATLARAMTLLAGLSDGKRTVGVISHVADLRERIPNKLIVTRTPTGSTVRAEIL